MISKRTLVLLSLLLAAGPALWSQEAPSRESTTEPVAELLADIAEADGRLFGLIDEAVSVDGEDRVLLQSQIGELADRQLEDMTRLVSLLQGGGGDETDLTVLEHQGEQLLRRVSRRLRHYIQVFRAALDREAALRETIDPGEIQVFEHRMAEDTRRLDRFYLGLVQVTDHLATLGQDVVDERSFLQQELSERGENLVGLLDLTKERLAQARQALRAGPEDAALQAQVYAAEERYESNKTSLLTMIHLMKIEGLDYVPLEVRTLELTGEITPEAVDARVAVGLLERELARLRTYLVEEGPRLLLRALLFFAILLVFWVLARGSRRLAGRVLGQRGVSASQLLKDTVVAMVGRLVLLVGFVIALAELGFDLAPIFAGLGIVGLVVGLALQDTLGNLAAGGMILTYRPFDVGDVIEVAGVSGKVMDMSLVSTRILTPDAQVLVVPNGKIWGDVIRNVTAEPQRRIDMIFGVSYGDDLRKTERVLREVLAEHSLVLDEPEPVVRVHALGDSAVEFVVRPWVETGDYWEAYWDITREVKLRFDREGLSIPYPQHDVHLVQPPAPE